MPRLTQQDLADRLGLDRSTVSKALKGDPAVAASTRKRVQELATELDFRPDPMMGALAAYRTRKRPEPFHAAIGWIHRDSGNVNMQKFPGYADYFKGAEKQARKIGYRLDPIDLDQHPAPRLPRLLQNRGIQAVVFAPQPEQETELDLEMSGLCGVAIGYSLLSPKLDVVTNDHFSTMLDLVKTLRMRGYEHLGCYLWDTDNHRMGLRARSAFLSTSRQQGIDVHVYKQYQAQSFLDWVHHGNFDAIIGRGAAEWNDLIQSGCIIPAGIGYAGYALDAEERNVSGMHHRNRRIGAEAVEWVARKFERGDFGLPNPSLRVLIPGEWMEGTTIRQQDECIQENRI